MIYLDNAATTKPCESALDAMKAANENAFYNPSALYGESVKVAKLIKEARDSIKRQLRAADEDNLYFTSGGTESDNWALLMTKKQKGSRIIISLGEHDAVINPANELESQGYDVVFCPINQDGSVNETEFERLLTADTSLVSIMHVSNETGAVNDIARLVKITKKIAPNAVFHSDGVQAVGKIKVNIRALGVDLYSISGHKIHAPKGIGGLFVKKGISLKPLLLGGGQEYGMRSGTENYPLICAFDAALSFALTDFDENYSKKQRILEYLKQLLLEKLPDTVIISPNENCAPNILTVAIKGARGEVLLHSLDKSDIMLGIGSACSSHHESRFKSLLGLDDAHRDGIIRFSVSQFNTEDEMKIVAEAVARETAILREFARK